LFCVAPCTIAPGVRRPRVRARHARGYVDVAIRAAATLAPGETRVFVDPEGRAVVFPSPETQKRGTIAPQQPSGHNRGTGISGGRLRATRNGSGIVLNPSLAPNRGDSAGRRGTVETVEFEAAAV
jgi:hypothetical protein